MKKKENKRDKTSPLRKRAEERLALKPIHPQLSAADSQTLIHELEVHQIELEMQNEELQLSHEALERLNKRFSELYDFAPVGYVLMDISSDIREANLAASDLLGFERGRLIGKPFNTYVHPDDKDIFYRHRRDLIDRKSHSCEIRLAGKSGATFYALLVSTQLPREADASPEILTAVFDITERKKNEQSILDLNQHLQLMNAELETFSSAISHELRNPLHVIIGCSGMLTLNKNLDNDDRTALDHISASIERISQIIDDLMALSKITKQELKRDKVNISTLARAAFDEENSGDSKRDVVFAAEPNLIVYADSSLVKILIANLVRNSLKYTSRKIGAHIKLGSRNMGRKQVFYINDNGIGFDMAEVGNLFKPFKRLSTGKKYPGTGIGLAIVKSIIDKHGGQIWAEGEAGKGATFYFAFE